jgi:hypothetical protein
MAKRFPYIVLAAAFSLAASAAYYSVFGLSKLFSSQATAIIILASTLEISKLITASYLHRYWSEITRLMRIYLTTAVIILMAITSLGIYGFLVSSYQDTAYQLQNLEAIVSNQETKCDRFQMQLNAVTREKQAVDKNVMQLTSALSNNQNRYVDAKGNQIVKTDAGNRKAYEKQLDISTQRLQELTKRETALSDSVTAIDLKITDLQTTSTVAAEVGPLKYIAKITGKSMDTVVNWLIIMLIIVFDPLAVILLISANKILHTKEIIQPQDESSLQTEQLEVIEEKPAEQVKSPTQAIDTKIQPRPANPGILSYRNKFRNEREKKYKK